MKALFRMPLRIDDEPTHVLVDFMQGERLQVGILGRDSVGAPSGATTNPPLGTVVAIRLGGATRSVDACEIGTEDERGR